MTQQPNIPTPTSDFRPLTSGLRIGFDAKRAFNNGTGLGNYSRFVIEGLVRKYPANAYFLFTPYIDPRFEGFMFGEPNVSVVTPAGFLGKSFPSAWRVLGLVDEIIKQNLDVFHGLSNELPIGIEKFTGRKVVTIHDLIFFRYPDYYNNIDRYIYTRKFKNASEKSDSVVAASKQTRSDLTTYLKTDPDKIRVVYQDCDSGFAAKATTESKEKVKLLYNLPEHYLLSVGTLERRKDQLSIIKAFHQLQDSQVKLVLVGRATEYERELKSYVESNKLEGRVLFLEKVEFSHLPAIYQLAKVFIYASEFEGFGIPILEALRSSLPVIAANTSSLTEVGGEAALYFMAGDFLSLAGILNSVLSSSQIRENMIRTGLLQAATFSRERILEDIMHAYVATYPA